jgi:FMN phosphatase YigB (HAD superfamily)
MQTNRENLTTIVFDLGGVLIDWNPRYLYREIFNDDEAMELFLAKICTPEWNEKQDAGRSLKEATDSLIENHPLWDKEIGAFYGQWEKMLNGSIEATVKILDYLVKQKKKRFFRDVIVVASYGCKWKLIDFNLLTFKQNNNNDRHENKEERERESK